MSAGSAATDEQRLAQLLADVEADPSAFDFFALTRLIDSLRPGQPRTGEALRPRHEPLRLGQAAELDFAVSPLHGLVRRDDLVPRLRVRFFGLLGPHGALPLHLTELVREQSRHEGDSSLADFLDLFHHRMLAFFYRAWAQSQPVVQRDRPGADRFQAWLMAMAGGASTGEALPPELLTFNAGWLAGASASPERLVKVLQSYLKVPVALEEKVGHWLQLDAQDTASLGYAANRAERVRRPAATLGQGSVAGSKVWDRQSVFRLRLGPLTKARYAALLPGGSDWPQLNQLVGLLAGRDKRWEVQLSFLPLERPECRLGGRAHLGVSSWLGRPTVAPQRELRVRPRTCFLSRHPDWAEKAGLSTATAA
ncbi:type VI secretion system baseplate subunit TssG [Roseateles sp. NT4]|uniref:type VI secretion system baseplate subunit TssG n=1 Tax=Roseateles sp. NT4 TaxID=3453715 RepID=UPI003EEBCB8D